MQSENKVFLIALKKEKETILTESLLKIYVLLLHQSVHGFNIAKVMIFVLIFDTWLANNWSTLLWESDEVVL